jgi:AraC-like DNA-binding protein
LSSTKIADITRELGISRSLLHIKMKTFFSSSMTDYIKQRRMTKACELLKEGNNVSETAYRTGFSDPNYFSKVFRKTYGMSPSDYISSLVSE